MPSEFPCLQILGGPPVTRSIFQDRRQHREKSFDRNVKRVPESVTIGENQKGMRSWARPIPNETVAVDYLARKIFDADSCFLAGSEIEMLVNVQRAGSAFKESFPSASTGRWGANSISAECAAARSDRQKRGPWSFSPSRLDQCLAKSSCVHIPYISRFPADVENSEDLGKVGSPGRIRTSDQPVNSRLLYH